MIASRHHILELFYIIPLFSRTVWLVKEEHANEVRHAITTNGSKLLSSEGHCPWFDVSDNGRTLPNSLAELVCSQVISARN